ncbi:hypothetical protein; putative exported protein [Xenorhabdus nematophila ATCC 19061]|uniref:Receptor ligand binding region domain-containing protein n=1 Tax=Xenorhabdus nematophila (strain ATCC 19061 / DSM 3370 / CCUG 14189 / LMG 1036 / NCIMB 9965 / AN6) TaxID=406817 RepID=D3VH51_XENNA|nr:ABC transporter substrate-binding protein [Xenorhabdus nematophila]CBJ88336.1 hypothetical protein; putative exported protein [Xenorhabdus nematophila ATCC 19061]CEK21253.1 hypothetical protein; putative exported protein [Xenorhabdus nematophila AN6/1]
MSTAGLIGMVGPLSGPRSAYGELLRQSARGSSLSMLWRDDAANPEQACIVAQAFIDSGVQAVIGHFNSECARVAGRLYQSAGIPLLLPAATASDLCSTVSAYRLCASERQQITAIVKYLQQHQWVLNELWSDGTVYGNRLVAALAASVSRHSPDKISAVGLMGAHHAIAKEIQRRNQSGTCYLVPDDCVIEEFDQLLQGSGVTTLCPHATPDFGSCVRLALQLISEAIDKGKNIGEFLHQHHDFEQRQYRHAGFSLISRHYG